MDLRLRGLPRWGVWALAVALTCVGCKEDPDDGTWPDPVSYALAIDCGGGGDDVDEDDDRDDGSPFLADAAYADGLGYGYEGGESASEWFPWVVGATPFPSPFRVRRDGMSAYRVDVPQEGPYVVTLGFAERSAHGPEFRVQDIAAEGEVIAHDLDVFALAGQDLAWTVRRDVIVTDGVLDITFASEGGFPPSLATLAVERANPDEAGPSTPARIQGIDSYGAVVLRWDTVAGDPGHGWDPSVAGGAVESDELSPFGDVVGYQLERKPVGEGTFSPLFGGTVPVPFHVDRTVEPGQRYEYRVRAVDVWGNTSDASSVATGQARQLEDSPIPVYEIEIGDEELRTLQADPYGETEVDLQFHLDGEVYVGDGRFRGASTRGLAKKSWRVELDEALPDGRHKLDLKAEWGDWTQLQELLSYDLFWAEGDGDPAQVQAGRAAPVQLVINGIYDGLRLDVERMDGDFLVNSGRAADGDLYRGGGFGELLDDAAEYEEAWRRRAGSGDIEHLIAFLEFQNRAHRDEFADALDGWLDLDAYVDLLAIHALLGRPETEADDYFYYRDPAEGTWEVLTWDNNNGNFGLGLFWPGLDPYAPAVHMSLWSAESAEVTWWHLLRTRLLNHPGHRAQLAARLEDLRGQWWETNAFKQGIHERAGELEDEIRGDPFKYPWAEHEGVFDLAEDSLVEAVDLRSEVLGEQLVELASMPEAPLVINEFGVYPCAEEGDCDPYGFVELFNRGDAPVEFAGYHLSADLRSPLSIPLPEGELAPGEFLRLDASSPGTDDAIALDVGGGELGLFHQVEGDDDEGGAFAPADLWWYGRLTGGLAYGRVTDGDETFAFQLTPTEGAANGGPTAYAPRVGVITVGSEAPAPGDPLPVGVAIAHTGGLASVECHWRAGGEEGSIPLSDDGLAGDEVAGDGVYGGSITEVPPAAIEVELMVDVSSAEGVRQVSPRTAPDRWRRVTLGSP